MSGHPDGMLARWTQVCGSLRSRNHVGGVMRIHRERQLNAVDDEVLALTAVVRPILTGVLYSTKRDVVAEAGGYAGAKLKMLRRLHLAGDGDVAYVLSMRFMKL